MTPEKIAAAQEELNRVGDINPKTGKPYTRTKEERAYDALKQKTYRLRLKKDKEAREKKANVHSPEKLKWRAKYDPENKVVIRYTPQKHQLLFRDYLDNPQTRVTLMLGGIRSGKTYAGAYEAVRRIYTKCPKPDLGWIVSPTYPMSTIVERAFEEAAGPLIIKKLKGERAYLLHPHKESKKPFRVEIKSAEHPDRLRGASLSWIWIDEAAMVSEECWKILLGRVLDSKGVIFMTTTPRGKNWLYHDVYLSAETDQRIKVVKASTLENKYLDAEDVGKLKGKYSQAFARQELEAEFVSFEGLVYPEFDFDRHTIPPLLTAPEGSEVLAGIDAGLKDPFVCLWACKWEGRWYIVDEYYCPGRTMESHANFLRMSRYEKLVKRRWADPSAAQERTDLDSLGITSYPAKNDVRAGINCVKRAFETDRIRIATNCVNTLRELGQYHYRDTASKNAGEEPVDISNHAMDALRYIIYSEEGYGAAHPYIIVSDDGKLVVKGQTGNPLSNRIEDWIAHAGNPMGQVTDDEWLDPDAATMEKW